MREIERLASAFLTEQLGPDVSIPVDIDILLERIDGVTLDILPMHHHGTEGAIIRDADSGELFVWIDERLADGNATRYRMTVAEELGHLILHRSVIEKVDSFDDWSALQRHRLWRDVERNAKRFAAAILMPGGAVVRVAEEEYPRLLRAVGFTNVEAIEKYLVLQLAKRFDVSQQTMRYRLDEWPVRVLERMHKSFQDRLDYLA